jgi:membrane-associated protease RseP (regulator of RpoE activity)
MDFIFYDLIFLFLFIMIVSTILYSKRKNIKKDGLMLLYRTEWGIKLIEKIGGKYKKTLKILGYFSITTGYILMAGVLYLFGKIFWIYLTQPAIVKYVKVPPIMPLVPYIDKVIPGFPPFYFAYFVIILAIIAIPHEFAHGIFSAYNKIKIKKTGFGFFPFFFPVFLAAFVEPDEKQMQKKNKFAQKVILSAGTFANLLTSILFFFLILFFFYLFFTPSGVFFDGYTFSVVETKSITSVNNISLNNPNYEQVFDLIKKEGFNEININEKKYFGIKGLLEKGDKIQLYEDYPAIKNNLSKIITKIEGIKIDSFEKLSSELSKKSPGDTVLIETFEEGVIKENLIILEEDSYEKGKARLGVYFLGNPAIIEDHYTIIPFIGNSNTFYRSIIPTKSILFVHNLLEWIILISLSVALVNMLPVGIFDGGRFFYLTIWGITKKESIGKNAFKIITYLFLLLLLIMMIFWAITLF